jgi:Na+(H+)/acetate symporter ActP
MKKNMSVADRIIRAVIAVAIIVLYLAGQITGTAAIILGILTVLLLGTSITGVCPGYWPFGISTLKKT